MSIKSIKLKEYIDMLEEDISTERYNARVIFVSDLGLYYTLLDRLSEKADKVIRISDFCAGDDTIPNLKKVINYIEDHKDCNILLPNIGEYLHMAADSEKNSNYLNSIIYRQAHSDKRLWIPIFSAKALFQEIVGTFDEERFERSFFEINDYNTEFHVKVFSNKFNNQTNLLNAKGLKEWLSLWDDKKIKSDMSFSTKISLMKESNGNYCLSKIKDPFTYICSFIKKENNKKFVKELGTDEQWMSIVPFVDKSEGSIEKLIKNGLNLVYFDPLTILSNWKTLADPNNPDKKWLFYIWYKVGLNKEEDYISYAINRVESTDDIPESIENSIFSCTDNPNFDNWLIQRKKALESLNRPELCQRFWDKYNALTDSKIKIKLLTGITHKERTNIIKIISSELSNESSIKEFNESLKEKYPDLALYLSKPEYIEDHNLSDYIYQYKINKIKDYFDYYFSKSATSINHYDYNTRSLVLNTIKNECNAYFLWIDGMGIEWIDMLVNKVKSLNPSLTEPKVEIVRAVLPTITKNNMDKADKDTISERKFDKLDSLSHIKDKKDEMDCNYQSIIVSQFELMDEIAKLVIDRYKNNPDKDIVITADHGMSRMAAKGFHELDGYDPKDYLTSQFTVNNLGRYCEMAKDVDVKPQAEIIKEDSIIAFKTHNHFKSPGYAPGELHGGASPEEILIPVIHFINLRSRKRMHNIEKSYDYFDHDVYLDNNGDALLSINTKGNVTQVFIKINGKKIDAVKEINNKWTVNIPELDTDKSYDFKIFLDGIAPKKSEKISVKRKGITSNDDFDI